MTSQRVPMSFLASYEKDSGAINELCRTCLCKTDDEYVSVDSVLPWSKLESCSAKQMIEKILDRELSRVQPQPQRICSICVKKIRAISMFRNQCLETDNILSEFQKHLQSKPPILETTIVQSDFMFDIDAIMFPEQMTDRFLPVFDSDIYKFESTVLEDIKKDLRSPLLEKSLSPMTQPKEILTVDGKSNEKNSRLERRPLNTDRKQSSERNCIPVEHKPTPIGRNITPVELKTDGKTSPAAQKTVSNCNLVKLEVKSVESKPPAKKRTKKIASVNDVDTYVDNLIKQDITTSIRSLEKKCKKEKQEENFSELCELCGLTFSNVNEYKKHVRSHEDKAKQTFKFHCKFCSKGFNHKQTYNIHHNSHTREIKFICDMCGKELATKNSLRIHFRYHLGIKNHICPKCGHRFVTPRELRDHVEKKHAAVRAIACTHSDCTETFDSEYRLNLHLRVHETNYAFVCDICGVATVSKFRLGIHKKIHTGEMIRQCPICKKSLAHDNALRRHIRNLHGDKGKSHVVTPKQQRTITLDGIVVTTTQ